MPAFLGTGRSLDLLGLFGRGDGVAGSGLMEMVPKRSDMIGLCTDDNNDDGKPSCRDAKTLKIITLLYYH
jgi:hypothetical protein